MSRDLRGNDVLATLFVNPSDDFDEFALTKEALDRQSSHGDDQFWAYDVQFACQERRTELSLCCRGDAVTL